MVLAAGLGHPALICIETQGGIGHTGPELVDEAHQQGISAQPVQGVVEGLIAPHDLQSGLSLVAGQHERTQILQIRLAQPLTRLAHLERHEHGAQPIDLFDALRVSSAMKLLPCSLA